MAILMLLLLALFLFISYLTGKKHLLSPWFLLCAVTLATYCIVLINYNNWSVRINVLFAVYLCTAILAFGGGTAIVNLANGGKAEKAQTKQVRGADFNRAYPVNLFLIVSVLFTAGYLFKLVSDAGGASSFSAMLRHIYDNRVNEHYSPGFIFNQFSEIIRAIAYLNTFRLFARFFGKYKKVSILKLIIPIILFIIVALIATDRNVFLRYGIYFICLWIFFYYRNSKKKNANARIICCVLIMCAVILLAFFHMGKLKQYQSNLTRELGIYGGSGLYNFNLWLETYSGSLMCGGSTFTRLFDTLGAFFSPFGVQIHGSMPQFDPMISFNSPNGYFYSSNVYSALKPYVEDFGYLGVIIFPFIIGAFYQWLYLKMKKSNCGFIVIAYCLLIYPVIFFPISEQLFRRLHLGFVYEIGWPAILYFAVYGRKKAPNSFKKSVKTERSKV